MTRPAIQAVVFDLDDTLLAERDYVRSGYRAVAEHLAEDSARAAEIADWMWDRFCAGKTDRMFNAAAERFGLAGDADSIARLVRVYREHEPTLEPVPEAVEVLDALAGRVKLGVISDGFLPAQRLKFDAIGLADRFDTVIFTESMGRDCWKPSPAAFERIAADLEVPHSACAYVGDNVAKDFVAPNALGWLSVLFRRAGGVHAHKPVAPDGRPHAVVDSAADLLSALGF